MSQDFMAKGTSRKRARRGGGGGGGSGKKAAAMGGPAEAVDMQQGPGNAAVAQMIAQEQKEQKDAQAKTPELTEHKLPARYRSRILADSGLLSLATTVFSEATAAHEKTDEMLAIAAVAVNQVNHLQQNSQDTQLFGGSKLDDLLNNKAMFLNAGLSRHATFHGAARFGTAFGSKEDLDAAKAAIDAASQVMLSGNPFMHDYLVFSADRNSPMADHTDQATSTKIGKFYFWAFKTETAGPEVAAEEETEVASPLMALAGVPDLPV